MNGIFIVGSLLWGFYINFTGECGAGNFPKVNLGVENPFPCSKLRLGAQNCPFSGYSVPIFMLITQRLWRTASAANIMSGGACVAL